MIIDISKTERAMLVAALDFTKKTTVDAALEALCNEKIGSYYDLIDYAYDLDILQDRFCRRDEK